MNFYKRSRILVLCTAIFFGYINVALSCGFTAVQSTGCAGSFTLNLQDTTSNEVCSTVTWTITLSNGTVLHTYRSCQASYPINVAGPVVAVMTDTVNGVPCSATHTYTVNPKPIINGSFSTTVTCVGASVCWNDASNAGAGCSPLSYVIDFGQTPFVTSPPFCKQYTSNGVFSPTIVVTNSCGCVADSTFHNAITVTPPPPAVFSGSPLTSCTTPLVSTMNVTSPGSNAKYYWYVSSTGTFSNTPTYVSSSTVFTHSYPGGIWSIKLVAVDTLSGCSDSSVINSYVNVGNNPGACFTSTDSTGCPHGVTFCPCSSVVGAINYTWIFTGSNFATSVVGPTTSNACQFIGYNTPGFDTTRFIVTYNGGCKDTAVQLLRFGAYQNINFVTPDTSICQVPRNVCVTYTGTPCPSCTFTWNPPPNTTQNSHTGTCYNISAYGSFTPGLYVQDTLGCITGLFKNNYIQAVPLHACAQKSYAHGSGCANDTIIMTNCSTGGPFTSSIWNFPGANIISQSDSMVVLTYPSTGCNNYSLSIQNTSGCVDTLRDSICISPKPSVNVTVTPHDLCFESICNLFTVYPNGPDTPSSVLIFPEGNFRGATSFSIINRHIDTMSDCYMYHNFGDFAYCFVAKNNGCVGDTVCLTASSDSVHVHAPIAKFTAVVPCSNTNSVVYTNHSLDYNSFYWTFQGVNYPNQQTITLNFPQCGVAYPVSLTATNDTTHCVHTKSDSLALVPCYGTDFKFTPAAGCVGNFYPEANIIFTGSNVYKPTSVIWDVEPTGTSPVFLSPPGYSGDTVPRYPIYGNANQFDACVQLKYQNGCIDTICKPRYLDMSQPTALFNPSDSAGCLPFCVQFTNLSTVAFGAISHFYWTFGDSVGVVDSVHFSPNHCYAIVGQFQACLNVVDSNGCTSSYCRLIQANSIQANFTETDSVTCTTNPSPLNPITYTDASTGFISSHTWILPSSLGPQPSSQGNTPSITEQYSNQGYGQICMVAVDQFGTCRDTVCKPVHVVNPIADYSLPVLADTSFPCPPLIINPFTNLATNNICTYQWDFGDGSHTDSAANASHIYTTPGNYCVKQVVTSCHGCKDSVTKYCLNINGPHVYMSANQIGGCPCLPISFVIKSWNADSLYVTSNGGIDSNGYHSFVNIPVIPRGTPTNPSFDTVSFLYCNIGDVSPSVVAVDHNNGCTVSYFNLIVPIPVDTPNIHFSYVRGSCGSDSICFTGVTTYTATYAHDSIINWDFGDGTTSNIKNPCHHYTSPGNYTVVLTVTNNVGCSSSLTQKIHVPKAPVAYFVVDDSLGCVPLLIHFTDSSSIDDSTSIVSGYWNFGDNNTINTTIDTVHNYTVPGNYNATLVITDGYGCTDSTHHSIQVQAPPTISAVSPVAICLGDTATLSGSGTSTLNWITHYNIDDTLSATPRVWPRVDTSYILRVGVEPRCYVYDTVVVNVSTISITQDTATSLCLGQVTSFNASAQSTHASVNNYNWSFGDGGTGTGQSVSHKYNTFGTYNDTLIVVNTAGCKDTAIRPVTIFDIPNAALSISADSVCLGAPVTMTNLSTAGTSAPLSTFYFDIQPDGTPDYTTSPVVVTYPAAGVHNVLLVQTDNNGCLDSARKIITVHALPVANFNNDTTCVSQSNTFSSASLVGDGSITVYNWTLNGVGIGGNASSFSNVFTNPGTNLVCLSVQDIYGCADTLCKNVEVFSSPLDTVSPLDTTICAGYSASFHVTGPRFDHVQWVPSTWVDNPTSTDVTITPGQTIRYQVYSYFRQCKPKIDTVNIWVIDSVPVSATADPENIVLGLSSNVTSTVKGTIDSIVWDPDSTLNCRNCRNPIATPSQTTTYNATVYYSKNGVVCSNRTSVTITVYKSCDNSLIYVPNTFTPNSDGKNDAFRLRGQGISKVNYFRVYDRWGKLVFEANGVDDPNNAAWNGGLHNDLSKPENSGVYVYVFEIQCVTGQTVSGKGNVTLVR